MCATCGCGGEEHGHAHGHGQGHAHGKSRTLRLERDILERNARHAQDNPVSATTGQGLEDRCTWLVSLVSQAQGPANR